MSRADLAAALRALSREGIKLDARALRLVRTHYRQLELGPLMDLLDLAAAIDSSAARLGRLPALMARFDDLAAVLGPAPAGVRELLADAVRLGASGARRMIEARSDVSYALSAEREARMIERSTNRLDYYWPHEGPRFRQDVQDVLSQGLRLGQSPHEINTLLAQRTAISQRRATLIARNETATAQGWANEVEQRELGITHFRWSTARDQRVRPSHRALEGRIFAWDHPPDEGAPGVPILCRCVAIPLTAEEVRAFLSAA